MDSIHAVARCFDGQRLRKARRFRRMTREELARRVGVSKVAIGKYENGMRVRPHVLVAIAGVLEVPVNFFAPGTVSVPVDPRDLYLPNPRRLAAVDRMWAAVVAERVAERALQESGGQGLPPVRVP